MKTKFILHGGRLKLKDDRNDSYFRELARDLVDGDEVLFIGFARRDEADRQALFEREKSLLMAQTKVKLRAFLATYDDLIEQIKRAKAIHITGGQTAMLVDDMRKYPDFVQSLEGKVVGGSSAGAQLFSKYYFSRKKAGVLEGLGTLPIRLLVHYGSIEFDGTEASLDLLKTYPAEYELVVLKECEWTVREAEI